MTMKPVTRRDLFQILAGNSMLVVYATRARASNESSATPSGHWQAAPSPAPIAEPSSIAALLKDEKIWGKDFPHALSGMPKWKQAGINSMLLFPDRIVSGRSFKDEAEAKKMLDTLDATTIRKRSVRKEYAQIKGIDPGETYLKRSVIKSFADDRSTRIEWSTESANFFARDLTMTAVRARHGEPQRVWAQAISRGGGFDRPLGLTSHFYANATIAFVKSDRDPEPDHIDRIVINCANLVGELFEET
jgi:hypothetical protein